MKLRKFNDFKKIYENNPGLIMEPGQEELMSTGTEVKPGQPQTAPPTVPVKPEKPVRKTEPDKIERPTVDPERKASYEEEEEAAEGDPDKMLQDLAEMLDAPLVDGIIQYDGHKIEFQSEPMCFAINGKSMKQLKTAQQVADYLMSGDTSTQEPGPAQAQPYRNPGQRFKTGAQAQAQMTSEKKHYHSHKKRTR